MVQTKKFLPIIIVSTIFIGSFLLSSVKLIPVLEFLKENPRATKSDEVTSIPLLMESLLSREQLTYYENTKWANTVNMIRYKGVDLQYGFHEYGAYVGWIPLLLTGIGLFAIRKFWALFIVCIFSLWISLGGGAFYNLWAIMHKLPIYNFLTFHPL